MKPGIVKLRSQNMMLYVLQRIRFSAHAMVYPVEKTIKPLIGFINLEWDKSLLGHTSTAKKRTIINTPSYNQVIKPFYSTSVGKWKRYKEEITPVYPILEKWIKEFNY